MVSARQSVVLKCILWVIPQIPQESFHSVSQLETLSTNSNYMQFILSYIIYHHIYFSSSSLLLFLPSHQGDLVCCHVSVTGNSSVLTARDKSN